MAARPMEQRNQPIRLLMLVKDQQEALLGLVDAENGLTLAAQMGDIWDMLPERATWVNREDKCFRSPLPLLNEADCDLAAPPPAPDESAGRPREVLPGSVESAADAGARNALP